jgi:hypothetical protein
LNISIKVYLRNHKKGIALNKVLRLLPIIIFLLSVQLHAQHLNRMNVQADPERKTLIVKQEIVYHNQSNDTLTTIVLNDWNNAYSAKTTPLAKRFADEFVRAFHLAKDEERGSTTITTLKNDLNAPMSWSRPDGHPDLVEITLDNPLYPNSKITLHIQYEVKVPDDRFTRYGYDNKGNFNLKNWYLTPARYDKGFVMYSNENIDDIANAVSDYEVAIAVPTNIAVTTDLLQNDKTEDGTHTVYTFSGKGRNEFNLVLEKINSFEVYKNKLAEVHTNLKDKKLTDIQRTLFVDQITNFVNDNLGAYPHGKIMVTQVEYDRNPVYGLNQLPAWLAPFPDSFLYEIKFLKAYLNVYIKNTLKIDPRKDSYIHDGIQMYLLMKYVEENHPDKKMMGLEWGILRGHHMFRLDFNGQYNYLYLLMARKNLDQPIGDSKDTFIKFNEQIAGKYKSGLSFNHLDSYLGNEVLPKSLREFYDFNLRQQTSREDFEVIVNKSTDKDVSWFFDTLVGSREIIDYKFGDVDKEDDTIEITVKNRTGTNVPIPLYGLKKDGSVAFKQWLENVKVDTMLTIPRQDVHKLVLNYNDEVPEYNMRNNFKSLRKFIFNKPVKFTFFQDLEDPRYNQLFFVPSFIFNIYDGVAPGLRLHNKSLLEKPFIFELEPTYSPKTNSLIGSASFMVNQYIRENEGGLYNIRYAMGGSTYHYAPDAAYMKFTPSVSFRFRDADLRKNKRQSLLFRNVLVNREQSRFVRTTEQNENYSVFNVRYNSYEADITRQFSYLTDIQLANNFGKLAGEFQFRRLFNDNRQINIRFYAGMFMYRSTNSDFFSFGVDRPNDYMFDYNLYGRSETSGLFSRQYVMAEGGFKSMLDTRLANQWLTTVNASFNIWNWIEVYGDAGLVKNEGVATEFIYDSGIRLNMLPDYFELYFPVYSSNGFELNDAHYAEKIRFVVTISPGTLINLFTRKWL